MCAVGRLVWHRTKILHLTRDPEAQIQTWLNNQQVLCGLRYLQISDYICQTVQWPSLDCRMLDLPMLIKKLANLKILTWSSNAPIPLEVLQSLQEHHKSAELRIFGLGRSASVHDPDNLAEIALAHCPALKLVTYHQSPSQIHPDPRLASFKRIVANAPNLVSASIVRLHSAEGDRQLTAVEKREQEELEQKFATHSKPNPLLRHITLDGFDLSAETLREWADVVDLSCIDHIKCSRGQLFPDYFEYAPRVLHNVKQLSLNLNNARGDVSAAVETYLTMCPPLTSLSLWSWKSNVSLKTVLAHHGGSLQTLQLHEKETIYDPPRLRPILDAEEVKAIRISCPKLRELTIDRRRHTRALDTELEADEALKELAEMKLSKLQLYYDSGFSHGLHPDYPDTEDVDEDENSESDNPAQRATTDGLKRVPPSNDDQMRPFVAGLWESVFQFCNTTSQQTLVVKFGEWEQKYRLLPQHRYTVWLARPSERDDESYCIVEKVGDTWDTVV